MKTSSFSRRLRAGAAALALLSALAWGSQAHALGTASGTSISNLATLSYSVGGVNQPTIGSSEAGNNSGAGTPTTFLVDNKVNVTVTEGNSTFTSVSPGTNAQVTTFIVANIGNTVQDYTLAQAQPTGGTLFGRTDNFDATNCNVFVESGATAGFQAGQDTALFIDELLADTTKTVYVVCDIPAGRVNGDFAIVDLTATARAGGTAGGTVGAALTETTGANTAGVDIVFADAAGTGADVVRNAAHSARDGYLVASAVISVTKTSLLLCDPSNGTTNPKAIPGAIVRWTITVTNANTATASATLSQVADTLNSNTAFDANLVTPTNAATCSSGAGVPAAGAGNTGQGFSIDVTGDTRAGAAGTFPAFKTTAADGDGTTHAAGAVTIDYGPALPAGGTVPNAYAAGELKVGESVIVFFNVTIN